MDWMEDILKAKYEIKTQRLGTGKTRDGNETEKHDATHAAPGPIGNHASMDTGLEKCPRRALPR